MDQNNPTPEEPTPQGPSEDDGMIRGQVRHQQLSARVPESVGRGVFSTGAIVLMGNTEFILDFVLRMQRPHQVTARVILPHAVMSQLINALEKNLEKYRERFGEPMEMPKPQIEPGSPRPSIEEVYDELKMPDEILSGSYANGVMISHSPAEFCFDFITNFFPRSAVSCRVFVSVPQVGRLLDALKNTNQEFQKRIAAARPPQEPWRKPRTPPATEPTTPNPYYPPSGETSSESDDQNPDTDRPGEGEMQ
ncbi:MAG: DUF3467 domain-containing protein [Phycisphaeraceae bacterium]|nr:DUF3467 domain-containing protein [Phycisphaeraceae bacterium]